MYAKWFDAVHLAVLLLYPGPVWVLGTWLLYVNRTPMISHGAGFLKVLVMSNFLK